MTTTRPPFRRRQFFIKQGFQIRFAIYPLVFFTVFLIGAGAYLHWELTGFLEFELYLPHSRLQNPWHEITPMLMEVVLWGGGAFLVVLAGWVWKRFGTLHRDLDRLADWLAAHARGQGVSAGPAFGDREVRVLGEGLEAAVGEFERWDERVRVRQEQIGSVAALLEAATEGDRSTLAHTVAEVRRALEDLGDAVGEVSIDESLS